MTTIRRNATRKIAAIRNAARTVKRYDLAGGFHGEDTTADAAFSQLAEYDFARLRDNGDGTYVVAVHSNLWYEIDIRPTAEQAGGLAHEVDYTNKNGHSGSILIERGDDRRNQAFESARQAEASGTTVHGVYVVVPGFGRLPVERPAEVEQTGAEPATDEQTDLDALTELVDEIERTPVNPDGSVTLEPLPAQDTDETRALEASTVLADRSQAQFRDALTGLAAHADAGTGVPARAFTTSTLIVGAVLVDRGFAERDFTDTGMSYRITDHGRRVAALLTARTA
jgi:hypothetical protein